LAVLRLRVFSEVNMKSFSFAKALTLGCFVCLALPIACGDDDEGTPKPNNEAGSDGGGAGPMGMAGAGDGGTPAAPMLPPGLSSDPSTETCGAETCESAAVAGGAVYVNPCCATDNACGLDTGFLSLVGANFDPKCQEKGQPGDVDTECPSAMGLMVPFQGTTISLDAFAGCCRDDGKCGVVINNVTSNGGKLPIAQFGLGCVDAAPFFDEAPASCGSAGGSGSGGAGGMGAGGEPTTPAGGAGGAGGAAAGGAGGAG
jgi:hypothetical protein